MEKNVFNKTLSDYTYIQELININIFIVKFDLNATTVVHGGRIYLLRKKDFLTF